MKRVKEAEDKLRARDFNDRVVRVYAAPQGHTATGEPGKTLTQALIKVLEEEEFGVQIDQLELRLEEKQGRQRSSNDPKVDYRRRLSKQMFPF